jgi:hypothetical protein
MQSSGTALQIVKKIFIAIQIEVYKPFPAGMLFNSHYNFIFQSIEKHNQSL